MVLEDILVGSSPFIMGIVIFFGFIVGFFLMKLPLEFAVLVGIPFSLGIIAYYIPAITPILAISCGIAIGLFFLKIVRR